jgi:Ulp1 family protease
MIKKNNLRSSTKLVILPFNFGRNHWVLIVVEARRKEILCLDSLNLVTVQNLKEISKDLGTLLKKVYSEDVATWNYKLVQCPSQTNSSDCGVLMCRNLKEVV